MGNIFEKQIQSIYAHLKNANLKKSEPIKSRFADIINYCYLGYALFVERDKIKKMKLGDLIETITTYTGIKWLVKKIWGDDCGCDERKEALNKIKIKRW